jgi:peptidoglycan-associated lipoprotein
MNHFVRSVSVVLLCLGVAACSSNKTRSSGATGADATTPSGDRGARSDSAAAGALDTDPCLRERVVYFDFDQDALRPESRAVVECHSRYLRERPSARVVLTGHADERGTRDYNVGLGERRGNAVSRAFAAGGASPTQLNVVSYGEERPTCTDSSEECWAMNRRVEIDYESR